MNVRQIAHRCLCDTMLHQQYASLNMRAIKGVSEADRALITQIVYQTLRNYRYVRYQWSLYVKRMPPKEIRVLLDMSTAQLLLLDRIPVYAVVNEAAEISRKTAGGSYVSLVNAVLHKVADNGPQKVEGRNEDEILAIETSHPDWLLGLWKSHYGREVMEKIARDDLHEGRIALRANTFITTAEELLKDEHFQPGDLPGVLYYDGNILNTDYFRNDLVIIQSQSSQQVVQSVNARKGEHILDMCAAPGTKCIQLAMMLENDCDITAVDLHAHRVQLIENSLEKLKVSCVRTLCADSRKLPEILPVNSFDRVMLDAPCSGLGTLKHKPEIKCSLTPEDIDDIVLLQSQLLEAGAEMVKDGGMLTYSTCTLNRKENERQVAGFLSGHPEFSLLNEQTIFPYEHDSDGFYIANMHKSMVELPVR